MSVATLPFTIDSIFDALSVGSLDKALTNNIYGINHMQNPGMVKSNRDQQGFFFLTRPQLNLQKDNIRNYRELYPLLDDNPNSLAKAIRMILDPRLGTGFTYKRLNASDIKIPSIHSNLVDPYQAFIPIITNNVTSVSGWPDMQMATKSSAAGLHKQVFVTADGIARYYGEYDISVNVHNVVGDPLSLLLYVWIHYMGAIKEGLMVPYMDHLLGDRIDYFTRGYRVVLSEDRKKVTKIFASIASFPTNVPTGMFADYNRETPFSEQTKEVSFRLKSMGFVAYDLLLIKTFNQTVQIFNPMMRDENRESSMILLGHGELRRFNHRTYPRINPETMAMEWWVTPSTYEQYSVPFVLKEL